MPLPLGEIDWNAILQQADMFPLVLFLGTGGVIAITAIIAVQWRKANETRLKEKMIDRGFDADEIARVISASPGSTQMPESRKSAGRSFSN